MERFLYLSIDLLSFFFTFIFSFYPPANFSKKWKYLWPAILLTAIPFIIWDIWFTSIGIWGFNTRYVSGIYLSVLPIEEVLFFICIPYACIFTYEAINFLIKKDYLSRFHKYISPLLSISLVVTALFHIEKGYTAVTFILTATLIELHTWGKHASYMGRFYMAFLFILIPFFIVNGILTGTGIAEPVVWYNNNENLGIRLGTIPFEDTFYGMLLILLNITIYEWLQKRNSKSFPSDVNPEL